MRFWFGRDDRSAERQAIVKLPWRIEQFDVTAREVRVAGWALPRLDGRPAAFTLDGRPFDSVRAGTVPLTNVAGFFPSWPGTRRCGFECRIQTPEDLFARGHARVERDPDEGRPASSSNAIYVPAEIQHAPDLPDPDAIRRVTGNDRADWFLWNGYTNYLQLELLLNELTGRGWPDGPILDWGCGCGRLTRWLLARGNNAASIYGADIDPVSVRWCRDHLAGGSFACIGEAPPTPYPDRQFALILAVSIFTHFSEPAQLAWLAELRRIAAPGALVLASTHGRAMATWGIRGGRAFREWQETGFTADRKDRALDGVVRSDYRVAYHTPDYVRRTWSREFDVLDVIPTFTHSSQDLVVLRARR